MKTILYVTKVANSGKKAGGVPQLTKNDNSLLCYRSCQFLDLTHLDLSHPVHLGGETNSKQ